MNKSNNQYGNGLIISWWVSISFACCVAGFVIGWLWDKRPGALSSISIIGVFTAFGTLAAAFGAYYAAKVALHIGNMEAERLNKISSYQSRIMLKTILPEIIRLESSLKKLMNALDLWELQAIRSNKAGVFFHFGDVGHATLIFILNELRTPVLDRFLPNFDRLTSDVGECAILVISGVVDLKSKIDILQPHPTISYSNYSISRSFISIRRSASVVSKNLAQIILSEAS